MENDVGAVEVVFLVTKLASLFFGIFIGLPTVGRMVISRQAVPPANFAIIAICAAAFICLQWLMP